MSNSYRKKPVVIEAFQMTKERREDNKDWPNWLNQAWNRDIQEEGAVWCENYPLSNGKDNLAITTLEGVMTVGWDDYIIKGVQGEIYCCKEDIFKLTYEKVEKR